MKKLIAGLLVGCMLTTPIYADAIFDRIMEIDNQVDQLLSERNGLITSKLDVTSPGSYETMYNEGQYKVGEDMPAGEYVFFCTGSYNGSMKETTDSNGTDRVDSEYFEYNIIYTLTDGNYVEINDAIAVPSDQVNELATNKGNGMFIVGKHIPAGEYKLIATDYHSGGSYKIFKSSHLANSDDRIKSEYFDKPTYVTVNDGEYLIISNALFVE